MPNDPRSRLSFFQKSKKLLLAYFLDEKERFQALFTLSLSLICILIMIGLGFVFSWWCMPSITAAFIAKDIGLLMFNIIEAVGVAYLTSLFYYLSGIYKNKLQVNWSTWLKIHIARKYLSAEGSETKNFHDILINHPEIDSPLQRIEEIDNMVESLINLSIGFIENLINLILYTVLLFCIGGNLQFIFLGLNIMIPQFPVITAFIVGIGSTLIGYWINRKLQEVKNKEIVCQTSLRENIQIAPAEASAIRMEGGQEYFSQLAIQGINETSIPTSKRIAIENRSNSFHAFNVLFQLIVPTLASAQMFFKDLISLDIFISLSFYFSMITYSLNFFIYSIEKINLFITSLNRVVELYDILIQPKPVSEIKFNNTNEEKLTIEGLQFSQTTALINCTIQKGQHTFIKDDSGTGISFFQTLAKTSEKGCGKINLPSNWKPYFVPQAPFIPNASIAEIVTYPKKYGQDGGPSEAQLIDALTEAKLDNLIPDLNTKPQAQLLNKRMIQQIVLARLLLKEPSWIFLDNATSCLNAEEEASFYNILKERLPDATVVSISNDLRVEKYHQQIFSVIQND